MPYSAEQMYDLVNDVESYPKFLPWCGDSQIHSQGPGHMTASISLVKGRVKQSFTTSNTMQPGRRIDVNLVSGPFKHLTGHWAFDPEDDHTCHITIKMEFEFKNRLLKLALEKVFSQITISLIETFTERAEQVYGAR